MKIKEQEELFRTDLLKRRQTDFMTGSRFSYLFDKKGIDPAYFVLMEPDDLPTRKKVSWTNGSMHFPSDKFPLATYGYKHAVVLSKGLEDRNRRIIAIDHGSWVDGLWVGLLRRQVRQGTLDSSAWCYGVLLGLEDSEIYQAMVKDWTKKLLTKTVPF